jgi:hypothetical protein
MLKQFLVQMTKTFAWCVVTSASLSGVGMMIIGFWRG